MAGRGGWGRASTRTEAHEKSMYRYAWHARSDAAALAGLIEEEVGLAAARAYYATLRKEAVRAYEENHADIIASFIKATEGQRPSRIRALAKGCDTRDKMLFLVLAAIGAWRTFRLFEMRDNFRDALAPGRGYRISSAGMYSFGLQAARIASDYDWPDGLAELARAYGHAAGDAEDFGEDE